MFQDRQCRFGHIHADMAAPVFLNEAGISAVAFRAIKSQKPWATEANVLVTHEEAFGRFTVNLTWKDTADGPVVRRTCSYEYPVGGGVTHEDVAWMLGRMLL